MILVSGFIFLSWNHDEDISEHNYHIFSSRMIYPAIFDLRNHLFSKDVGYYFLP